MCTEFAAALLNWFEHHGRKDLPWQKAKTPYRVWVSEIMLQQTQVTTVIPYYERFMAAFPALPDLASASQDEVLTRWAGLGYYARGRNLHKTAQICVAQHDGNLPDTLEALMALPGIGRSTAGAILSLAHGIRAPILDGNVKRVLTRHFGLHGWPGASAVERKLWAVAEAHTPYHRFGDYTQAIMDLGATVCTRTRPQCPVCPHQSTCYANTNGLTEHLPERKPRKSRPTRKRLFFIMQHPDGILLEQQPENGIWGGLWSLPSHPVDADPSGTERGSLPEAAVRYLRTDDPEIHFMKPVRHIFSHFELEMFPVLVSNARKTPGQTDDRPTRWVNEKDLDELGLPAPIRKIVRQALRAPEQMELWSDHQSSLSASE